LFNRYLRAIIFSALAGSACAAPVGEAAPMKRIAFGSCFRQDRNGDFWVPLLDFKPQLMIFLGDNGYPDQWDPPDFDRAYQALTDGESYTRLQEHATILATWDDHDFGANDAGKENPHAALAKQAFLKYWEVPEGAPMRKRPGVYAAHMFGTGKEPRVQVILLDTRSFRDPLKKGERTGQRSPGYVPDFSPEKTMLGKAQWDWLESVLMIPADLRLIASSIQVIPEEHRWEKWANLPLERTRLLRLIGQASGRSLILSGDRHRAEISVLPAGDYDGFYLSGPLVEITSSSLNAGGNGKLVEEPNRWRMPGSAGMQSAENFGALSLVWRGSQPEIRAEVRDTKGSTLEQITILGEL
jgi:alkaline phosphatase D